MPKRSRNKSGKKKNKQQVETNKKDNKVSIDEKIIANEGDAFVLTNKASFPSFNQIQNLVVQPILTRRLNWRDELGPALGVFFFALMLYGITAPREVALEDDGLFLMILEHFGVGHPPGYPLYSLLGSPFYHLLPDFLSPAYRGHMFSGFAGAITCIFLYLIVAKLINNRFCAFLTGAAYAASECFWSQAIIAEVYTLNTAMYFLVMYLCLVYASNADRKNLQRMLYALIAFTYGVSLTNHWPLIGLGTSALVLMVLSQWRSLFSNTPIGVFALLVGLLPYAWFVWRSYSDTALNFYGPVQDLRNMWFYVTRSGYSGVDKQSGVGLDEKIEYTIFFFDRLVNQITPAGIAIVAAGYVAMLRTIRHFWLAIALTVGWITSGPLLIIMIDFKTEFIWFSAFRVYFLPCYGITLIFFGYGLAWIGSKLNKLIKEKELLVRSFVGGLGIFVVAFTIFTHWEQNNRSKYTWARDVALYKLLSVDANAHLFTFDDLDLPVGYLNMVEGIRPDLKMYNDQGLVFGRRIYTPFTPDKEKTKILKKFAEQETVPIFYHPYRTDLFSGNELGSDFLGFWRRVNQDDDQQRVILSNNLLYWLQNNLSVYKDITDRWTRQQAGSVISTLITAILQANQNGFPLDEDWEAAIDQAYRVNELVHLYILWNDVTKGIDLERAKSEIRWIDGVVENKDDYILDNSNIADILLIKSWLIQNQPDLADKDVAVAYEEILLKALEFDFKFSVFKSLMDYYRGTDRHQEGLDMLVNEFPVLTDASEEFQDIHNLLSRELKEGVQLAPVVTFS